jgi:hypothetical protein
MRTPTPLFIVLLFASPWWLGCNKSSPVASSAPASAAAPLPTPSASAEHVLPPGHPAIDKSGSAQNGLPPGHPAVATPTAPAQEDADLSIPPSAGGLTWSAPAPLQRRAPKSTMRAAEYGVEGDPQAELSVFYFGPGQGGAVDANITRWLGQLTQPDGSDTTKRAKRADKKVHGIAVTTVEATGGYSGGMGGGAPIEHATLLGAIATGSEGPVFFKLVGSSAVIAKARPSFEALVASLHAAGPK